LLSFNKKSLTDRWSSLDVESLLSEAAQGIEAGSATDSGRFGKIPTNHPDPIFLAGGIPDDTALPIDDLIQGFTKAIKNQSAESLMYGGWFGYSGCREAIAERQNKLEGTHLTESNIIMHNGSSGCLENILRAFVQPGDVVIVESPSYSGTVRAILGYQAEVVEVPMNRHGIDPDLFAETVLQLKSQGKRVKLFYTIPDYHNPMGNVTDLEIRQSILQTCGEHKIIVAEDAAYSELHYDVPPPPSYYALSDGHGVLRMCSFSKIIATGLRAGWIQARKDYADVLTRVRFDMGNSPLVHFVLEDFIKSGRLDTHVESMRKLYREKCFAMLESLKTHCEPYTEVDTPEGGYFLWVKARLGKASELVKAATDEGLIFPEGNVFFVDKEPNDDHFRLAFTRASFEHIEESGKRLRKAFEKILD